MIRAIEAEISTDGRVTLNQPLVLDERRCAVLTIMEPVAIAKGGDDELQRGNVLDVLKFLNENRLPPESRPSAEEVDAHVQEIQVAWE
ncbi:MAG: hypothetical protein HQL64_08660 [Magnetococcales bacterium]|nr:hypothetical protein [Magnetococcales bacterium]